MKLLKYLLVVLTVLSLTGCKKEKGTPQEEINEKHEEVVQYEKDSDIEGNLNDEFSLDNLVKEIEKDYEGNSRYTYQIYYSEEESYFYVKLYAPETVGYYYEDRGVPIFDDRYEKQWNGLLQELVDETTKIKKILLDNGRDDMYADCSLYADDVLTTDKSQETVIAWIVDGEVLYNDQTDGFRFED